MICVKDESEIYTSGNFQSIKAQQLQVVFERCDPEKHKDPEFCQSEEKIDDFLIFKYIVTLTNEKYFIEFKFGDERIDKIATLHWNLIDPYARIDFSYEITRLELDLTDSYWGTR